ncbi:lytic transglycosylase domain-containing protein [Erythrobacter sp. NE805]|uniref:lytic transglycosylase domain-containing protein n=1 Tax=Erythrobacter sp. NE805 TaxID=3389875 RepID=UPI00396B1CB8
MTSRRLSIALACALILPLADAGHAQAASTPAPISDIDIAPHVREAAQRFGVPENWIHAVIRTESAGRVRAVSSAGAMGLMQLMPGTWARQRARLMLGTDPFDPRDNILAGTAYLREMYDRYGAIGFLAAYNAGPGRYEEWRDRGRPLPLETRRYVASVAALLQGGSVTVAAAMQPAGNMPPRLPREDLQPEPVSGDGNRQSQANPFARPAAPGHDLFAPVRTTGDE